MSASAARPRSHLRLTAFLMGGALLGKLLGFLREIEFARLLGASYVADSFRGALTATLLPISFMQGDMIPSVLIPLHRRWSTEGRAPALLTALMAVFTGISIAITVLVWMFAGWWVDIVVGGFGPDAHAVTVGFVRIMALSMPAATVSGCMSCIEISVGRSRITTIRASLSNVGIMIGIAVMALTGHVTAIAWGYVIAFNLVILYGGIKLWQEGEIVFAAIRPRNARIALGAFFIRMRPLFIQPFADQGNILLERFIGSTLAIGSLASLDYARTLTETALYLVSQPIGYVVLAQHHDEAVTVRSRVMEVARPLLALSMPAALFLFLFAPDIVSLVFQRGVFQDHAVALTASALRGISVGLWASTLGWILIRMINAAGRNGHAARVIVAAYTANIAVNSLAWLLTSFGVLGLGLGEAARGLTLLGGAALALGCLRPVLVQVVQQLPCLLLLASGASLAHLAFDPPLARVLCGGSLFGAGIAFNLLPHLRSAYSRFMIRRRRRPAVPAAVE